MPDAFIERLADLFPAKQIVAYSSIYFKNVHPFGLVIQCVIS